MILLAQIRNRICNNSGETIGETLVSLLIAALALTMLAGAVGTATNIILMSRSKLQRYYDNCDDIVSVQSGISDPDTGTIYMTVTGDTLADPGQKQEVELYVNDEKFGNIQIAAYRIAESDNADDGQAGGD